MSPTRTRGDIQQAEALATDVKVDRGACIACGACTRLCSAGLFEMRDGKLVKGENPKTGCAECGHCMAVCPTEAIFAKDFDYSGCIAAEHRPDDPERLAGLFAARRSVRDFSPEPIPREVVERIIKSATEAPMALPPQKLGITAIIGREKVGEIAKVCEQEFERFGKNLKKPIFRMIMWMSMSGKDYKFVRRFVGDFLVPTLMASKAQGRDGVTYGAPALLLIHGGKSDFGGTEDAQILATYLQLAATAEGWGSIILGDVPPLFENFRPQYKAKYGIPNGNKVILSVALGKSNIIFLRSAPRKLKSVNFS
ncbi:MAG: nitroreductase family protein [Candidatus Brocadiia bacterium]